MTVNKFMANGGDNFTSIREKCKVKGWGLTMEERVRLLQGSFEVTSAKGKGTRIAYYLAL